MLAMRAPWFAPKFRMPGAIDAVRRELAKITAEFNGEVLSAGRILLMPSFRSAADAISAATRLWQEFSQGERTGRTGAFKVTAHYESGIAGGTGNGGLVRYE